MEKIKSNFTDFAESTIYGVAKTQTILPCAKILVEKNGDALVLQHSTQTPQKLKVGPEDQLINQKMTHGNVRTLVNPGA